MRGAYTTAQGAAAAAAAAVTSAAAAAPPPSYVSFEAGKHDAALAKLLEFSAKLRDGEGPDLALDETQVARDRDRPEIAPRSPRGRPEIASAPQGHSKSPEVTLPRLPPRRAASPRSSPSCARAAPPPPSPSRPPPSPPSPARAVGPACSAGPRRTSSRRSTC